MGLRRHVRDGRFTWLIALVFTVFLFPTVLWAAEEQDSILGTWKVTSTQNGAIVAVALVTFSPGGGLVMDGRATQGSNENDQSTGHGTWVHRGGNEFAFAFERIVIRNGKYLRNGRLDETITITGDTYQGKFEGRAVSLDGKISPVGPTGTTSAVRLKLLE